ncbi:DUF5683 domain-containing protein [Mucilaginibacter antarcticus]|uniref:DUF5683 domain-containing protein n=1 Tax=Mucilaginibacter antarcticus TaxID=1855725 RepID=A0ABW5XTQ6_9SPHI
MYRYLLILTFVIAFGFTAAAQNPLMPVGTAASSRADSLKKAKSDSIRSKPFAPKTNTVKIYHPDSTHSPSKAWHRSVAIPGWGQVYNKRIWKVPVIYTGLTLLVLMYRFNQDQYTQFLGVAKLRARGEVPGVDNINYTLYQQVTPYPDQAVNDLVRGYARYRDLSVLLFAAAWGIQTIDAYVDAKFQHSYSMDDDFSVRIRPTMINQPVYAQNYNGSFIPGLKVTFTLR